MRHKVQIRVEESYCCHPWLRPGYLATTYPAMLMEGALPNFFTINGKACPATDTVKMKVGETIKLRFIGSNNNFVHPMHVHGGPFTVVARDGYVLPESARFEADTVNVGPGQRYDVIWKARRPGKWLVHCHIPHHTANNDVEHQGGGRSDNDSGRGSLGASLKPMATSRSVGPPVEATSEPTDVC